MKVAVTARLPGNALDLLEKEYDVKVRQETNIMDKNQLADFIGDADAAITLLADNMSRGVMERCPNLKVIANYAVGYNNIDIEAARDLNIWVTNTPDVLTEATADLAWTLILSVTRRVLEGHKMVIDGSFDGWRPDLLLGDGLQGKTLGIVGFGRIGQAVARRAVCFGMNVIYTSHKKHDGAGLTAEYVKLSDLVKRSDIISLHCPLTPETRYMFNKERIASMKKGAYLINTARGPVVDEEALVDALKSGHLAGAGLDVFENEPSVHPGLLKLENVVLMPHAGSATVEARTAMANLAVENVRAVLAGREPPTPVVQPTH